MYVSDLIVTDFRNYRHAEVCFPSGINVLVGPNGQGKTNLVEAIAYLATLRSHRAPSDTALIRAEQSSARLAAKVVSGERSVRLECDIQLRGSNKVKINGSPARKPRDLLGICHVVVFAPEDLSLVKGDPDGRRGMLDDLIAQLTPRLAGTRSDYDRVLKQRTALLKSASGRRGPARSVDQLRTLDTWDAHLARHGAELIVARRNLVEEFEPLVANAYRQISGLPMSAPAGNASLRYRASVAESLSEPIAADVEVVEAQFVQALTSMRDQELERGQCLVGPHRDDVLLSLGDLPAKGYASHGESWSLALALKLGAFRLLESAELGDGRPVLILDDVFAELDVSRRAQLAQITAKAEQAFITAAAPLDIPEELGGARFDVMAGEVTRVR